MPLPGLSVWEVNRIVGADAHIGPAECTVFSEICGEFATSQRADVGIGPYISVSERGPTESGPSM